MECRLQPFPIFSFLSLVSAGSRRTLAVTSSVLIKVRNDSRYKRWFDRTQEYEHMKMSQPERYKKIRAKVKSMMKRANLDPGMLDNPDRTVNVDVGKVKEAKDAQENGQAPSAGGEKKKMQLKFIEKRDMTNFPDLTLFASTRRPLLYEKFCNYKTEVSITTARCDGCSISMPRSAISPLRDMGKASLRPLSCSQCKWS